MDVTSIILAGGKNLRLGRNKALEIIEGKSILERVLDRLTPISDYIIIVTSWEQFDLPANEQVEVVADIYPEKGPLGGIYSGLMASKSSINVVVACDMPFLNTELFRYMISLSGEHDAVVPRLENRMIEPLHAVYSRKCLARIDEQVTNNRLSIHEFLDNVDVRYIEYEESRKIDPELLSFFNINYQSDLDEAVKLVKENRI